MKSRDILLKVIGAYFLLLGIFSITYAVINKNPDQILWLCYISLTIIGIGVIIKNKNLILSQITILTIPLIIWNMDFFYHLITKNSLWGITDYFFESYHNKLEKFISLQHIYVIPITLTVVYLIKNRKYTLNKILKISFIQMALIFIIGRFFTNPESNMNCVFRNCLPLSFNFPYPLLWIISVTLMILITAPIIKILADKISRTD